MKEYEYTNGEVTIVWKPEVCQHSRVCVKTLPKVYDPNGKPWIKPENASTQELIDQVSKCPSGALTIREEKIVEVVIDQEDNGKKGRFVLYENGKLAGEMTYVWNKEDMFIIDHTEVMEGFESKGYGKKLVLSAVDFARRNSIKILPLCPFANRLFKQMEELNDVRA